jgi:hypothetical protein
LQTSARTIEVKALPRKREDFMTGQAERLFLKIK